MVWRWPHLDVERSTLRDVTVVEPGTGPAFAIEGERLDVGVAGVGAGDVDLELLAVAEVYRCPLEEWRAEDVVSADGVDGVEAERAQDVPSGHLAYVFVPL